jgi:type I restriction enzyme R subunit
VLGELFDPKAELFAQEHFRPHRSQAGAVVFISFRAYDSIPREVLERWEREKQDWLRLRGHGAAKHWSLVLPTPTDKDRADFQKQFHRCREDFLDTCQGRCLLRRPELARIVADSLLHLDRRPCQWCSSSLRPSFSQSGLRLSIITAGCGISPVLAHPVQVRLATSG